VKPDKVGGAAAIRRQFSINMATNDEAHALATLLAAQCTFKREHVTQSITRLLKELKEALQGLYGSRLRGLYLYGSYARGEAIVDSDVDLLVVLDGIESYGAEIDRTGSIISSLSLKYGVSISRVFASQQDWSQRSTSSLANVGDEAIPT